MTAAARSVAPVLILVTTSACVTNSTDDPGGAADCTRQLRLNGILYSSHGYSERDATEYALAEQAECHDLGADATGSVFPEDPHQVTTWAFAGYPTEKVLGVRFDNDSFAVFVSDSVPREDSERIFKELRQPENSHVDGSGKAQDRAEE